MQKIMNKIDSISSQSTTSSGTSSPEQTASHENPLDSLANLVNKVNSVTSNDGFVDSMADSVIDKVTERAAPEIKDMREENEEMMQEKFIIFIAISFAALIVGIAIGGICCYMAKTVLEKSL